MPTVISRCMSLSAGIGNHTVRDSLSPKEQQTQLVIIIQQGIIVDRITLKLTLLSTTEMHASYIENTEASRIFLT